MSHCWHLHFSAYVVLKVSFIVKDAAADQQWVCASLAGAMTLLVVDLVKDWQTSKPIDPESISEITVILHTRMHHFRFMRST